MQEFVKNKNQPNESPSNKPETFREYIEDFELTDSDLRESLLDVGVGSGEFIQYLRTAIGNKSAFGVELSDKKVLPNTEGIVVANGLKLPFGDDSFEKVIGRNYVPELYDNNEAASAIIEMIRVARSGGTVKFTATSPRQEHGDASYIALKRETGARRLFELLDTLENQGYSVHRHQRREDSRWVITIIKPAQE